jgi:glucosamine kinase
MSTEIHIGIDIGGTASRWVACDGDGAELARGKSRGATAHLFNPAERDKLASVLAELAEQVRGAGLVAQSVTAGVTGFGAAVRDEAVALFGDSFGVEPARVLVTDDIRLAYAGNFAPGEGHLISAGTGSIGVHIDAQGQIHRVGGRGIFIDDAGSGSWIALRGLDLVFRSFDETGNFEAVATLANEYFEIVGGKTWDDVRSYVYGGDRGRIGLMSVAVGKAAHKGDALALSILSDAGRELARLALGLEKQVGQRPICLVGGVGRLHPVIFEQMRAQLEGRDVAYVDGDAALTAAQLQNRGAKSWLEILR